MYANHVIEHQFVLVNQRKAKKLCFTLYYSFFAQRTESYITFRCWSISITAPPDTPWHIIFSTQQLAFGWNVTSLWPGLSVIISYKGGKLHFHAPIRALVIWWSCWLLCQPDAVPPAQAGGEAQEVQRRQLPNQVLQVWYDGASNVYESRFLARRKKQASMSKKKQEIKKSCLVLGFLPFFIKRS